MKELNQQQKLVSNDAIDNYIQQVSKLSQSEHKIPSNEELEKIAAELGISKGEIDKAQQQSQEHFVRAKGYFELKYWDEAISELQEAVVFNPSNLDMLILLANSHLGRWYQKHYGDDKQQVKNRIRQCLEIKPDHQESLQLLLKLDHGVNEHQKRTILFSGLLMLFIGSIVGYFFLNGISLNLFTKNDIKLEQLKLELIDEINQLQKEQTKLQKEQTEFLRNQEQKNQLNLEKITKSEQTIQKLEQQNKILNQRLILMEKKLNSISQKGNTE